MKRKLGALLLALASLALSAACASSKTWEPQGELSSEARPSTLPGQPANTADVQMEAAE
jgi:ABC-type phosphate/phosphonate transport system substrate-binding protein